MPSRRPRRRLAIPRRVALRGKTWRVRMSRKMERGLRGLCDPDTLTIWIWARQSREERERTFLHEVLHALAGEPPPGGFEAEEGVILRLEAPLHAALLSGALVAVPEEVP